MLDPFWEEPPPPSPELVTMQTMRKAIDQVNVRLGWVAGLLAVIAAVVIFR